MLYTLGDSGWTPAAIQEAAQAHNAVVCDIRYLLASRHLQWTMACGVGLGPKSLAQIPEP